MSSNVIQSEKIKYFIDCLYTSFTAVDKPKRKKAEEILKEFQKDIPEFANLVFFVVKSTEEAHIKKEIKLSAIISLNKLIKSEHSKLNPFQIEAIFNEYIKCIMIPQINDKLMKNLGEGFKTILNLNEETPEFCLKLLSMLSQNLNTLSMESIKGLVKILIYILNSSLIKINNYPALLDQILKIILLIHDNLYSQYIAPQNAYNTNKPCFLYLIDTIGELYIALFTIISKLASRFHKDKNSSKIINIFSCFLPKAFEILLLNSQNKLIISFTALKEYDIVMNRLKIKIFKYINSLAGCLPDFVPQEETQIYSQIAEIVFHNLEWLINNKMEYIIYLVSSGEEEDEMEYDEEISNSNYYLDNKYSLLISRFVLYLNKIFSKETFLFIFEKYKIPLFKNILLPLLILTKDEMNQVTDQSESYDYGLYLNDVVKNNKYKNIKSSVSLLIKTLYTKDNQMFSFICKYILLFLSQTIGIETKDTSLISNEDKVNVFLQNDIARKIDLSLLVLCIINYTDIDSTKNSQNIFEIKMFFEQAVNLLLDAKAPVFIKHKMLLFINAYLEVLYENINDDFLIYLNYLLQNLLFEKEELLQKEAGLVLADFFEKYKEDGYEQIIKYIEEFNPQIIETIKTTNVLTFFDLLLSLVECYGSSGKVREIFVKICERIGDEVERHFRLKFKVVKGKNYDNSNQYELLVNKSFNIVRTLANNKTFVTENMPIIEKSIGALLPYMDNISKIDFDEDLVLIIISIIKNLDYIPQFAFDFLKFAVKYAEKNQGMLLDLFELVNLYLIYGAQTIEKNPQDLTYIVNIFNISIKEPKFQKSPFYASILLQIWFLKSSNIPTNVASELIALIINKIILLTEDIIQNKEAEAYNYLGYITFIYSAFTNYHSTCINELSKVNQISNLKNWTEKMFQLNETCEYQTKILVISICNILEKEYFINDSNYYFNISLYLLSMQRKNESNLLKKKLKKKLYFHLVNDDEDEEDEDNQQKEEIEESASENAINDNNFDEYNDEQEVRDLVERTKTELKESDEYKLFKKTIVYFQKNHPDIVASWISSLDDPHKVILDSVLQTFRITVNTEKTSFSIPRKIVSIKRTTP